MNNNTIFCYSCGHKIHQSAVSCPQCGASQQRASSGLKYQSYKEVPFYRRNWFAIVMAFSFVPALLLILITGGVYYERNGLKKYSIPAKIFLIAWSGLGSLMIAFALLSSPESTEIESTNQMMGRNDSTSAQKVSADISTDVSDRTIALQYGGDQGIPFGEFIKISEQTPGSSIRVSVKENTYRVEQTFRHANLRSILELTPYQANHMLVTRVRVNRREAKNHEFMGALTEILSAVKYSMEIGGYEPTQEVTRDVEVDRNGDDTEFKPSTQVATSPKFTDFPAPPPYAGSPGSLQLSSDLAKSYRSLLSETMLNEPTFAGEYVTTGWGCGSGGCYVQAIINKRTGKLVETTFAAHNVWLDFDEGLEERVGEQIEALRLDSSLLVTREVIQDDQGQFTYFANFYTVDDSELTLIRKIQIDG